MSEMDFFTIICDIEIGRGRWQNILIRRSVHFGFLRAFFGGCLWGEVGRRGWRQGGETELPELAFGTRFGGGVRCNWCGFSSDFNLLIGRVENPD
jgi:hypothetical protein